MAGVTVDASDDLQLTSTDVSVQAELDGGGLPAGGAKIDATVDRLTNSSAGGRLDALNATVAAADTQLKLQGAGNYAPDGSGLAGSFTLSPVSLRELLATGFDSPAPETSDPAVLGQFEANGQWRLGNNSYELSDLTVRLDDTTVKGSAAISEVDKPRIRFDFTGDQARPRPLPASG